MTTNIMLDIASLTTLNSVFVKQSDLTLFMLDAASLPNLHSLQSGLLNDEEYVEGTMSVLSHLLTFALDDPGVPTPKEVMD